MKLRSKTFYSVLVLALVYAAINILAAPPRTTLLKYNISEGSLRLLSTTVVLPVITIWFIGLYGYQKLRTYANYIQDNKEGRSVSLLTRGLLFFVLWLPISSTSSAILNLLAVRHHLPLATATIISSYLSLLFPLVAFLFINAGTQRLSELSKLRPNRKGIHGMALILIIAGVAYGYLIANVHGDIYTIYHMPMLAVLATIVMPYIFSWYLGLLSVNDLHLYTRKVRGIIFRKGWNAVATGIAWLICTSIILQYMTTVSIKLGNIPLGWTLVIIYTLLPIIAVGYVFIAIGAKRLTKIEEA